MSLRIFGTLVLLLTLSTPVWSCGESLYRVGKGVAYREFVAPLPGNLLIYANTPDGKHFAEAMRQSGHEVRYTEDLAEFEAEAASGRFDVIIAPFTAGAEAFAGLSAGRFLPVTDNAADEREARRQHGKAMRADKDEIRHFLKAIHIALKQQN